jgi:hypothetical protein
MLKSAATIIAIALGAHILLKFAFFAAPYRRRRAALDRACGNRDKCNLGIQPFCWRW